MRFLFGLNELNQLAGQLSHIHVRQTDKCEKIIFGFDKDALGVSFFFVY
jgi:hypothetical protein